MTVHRPLIAVSVAALIVSASTVPARAGISGPTRTIVMELATPGDGQPAAVVAGNMTAQTETRAGAARALLASGSERNRAVSEVRAAGLTILGSSVWSVTATGSAAAVDAIVGLDPEAPVVPTGWTDSVAHIIDASAEAGAFKAHAAQSFDQLSQAYSGATPSSATPSLTASTPIVATLQLSGWDAGALTADAPNVYADSSYDPVASGQFTAVSAGRTSAYQGADAQGDSEVDLDQETLLATAPELKQRAYFALNSAAGYLTGLQDIYADVVAGLPIVALSTSWGTCETADSSSARTAIDGVLAKLVAVGVTVFAASGDLGMEDCTNSNGGPIVGVDFPGSDPHVVAVGATTHENGAAAPAPDTVWSQPATLLQAAAGSGGGVSTIFAKPSYQSGVMASGRAVPDIALDGDPNTGVSVVTESGGLLVTSSHTVTGGTSLAAPLAAGLIADAAAARDSSSDATGGYGDIHATLYAHPEVFTDVVADTTDFSEGDSGFVAEPAVGYDEASGLGTPSVPALAAVLNGTPATPASTATAAALEPTVPTVRIGSFSRRSNSSPTATASWSVSGGTSAISGFQVVVRSGTRTLLHTLIGASARSAGVKLPAGAASLVTVTAISAAGTSSATASLALPADDRSATAHRGWSSYRDPRAFLGTLSVSAARGRRAVLSGSGAHVRVTFRDGPTGGTATVLVDGRVRATVDTYAAKVKENVTTTIKVGSGRHTVTVVVTGRRDSRSHGTAVALDAVGIA